VYFLIEAEEHGQTHRAVLADDKGEAVAIAVHANGQQVLASPVSHDVFALPTHCQQGTFHQAPPLAW
jgi:hypothetical protein